MKLTLLGVVITLTRGALLESHPDIVRQRMSLLCGHYLLCVLCLSLFKSNCAIHKGASISLHGQLYSVTCSHTSEYMIDYCLLIIKNKYDA